MTKGIALLLLCSAVFAQDFTPTASPTPARSVRISFVPPPLEGTISLGIYDENDQLVRVLHQEAPLHEFTPGPDALMTKWDGKDDFGYDLWPGTYHARGYLVAPMKIQEVTGPQDAIAPSDQPLKVRLMANPLENNERPTIQLTAGIDDEDVLLKTANGLPLFTITPAANAKRASLAPGEDNSVTLIVETPGAARRFTVSGINRMMAFDCGEFELK